MGLRPLELGLRAEGAVPFTLKWLEQKGTRMGLVRVGIWAAMQRSRFSSDVACCTSALRLITQLLHAEGRGTISSFALVHGQVVDETIAIGA